MEKNDPKLLAVLSSPGKVIICGEHAVVYGQDALAISINLRCTAKIYENQYEKGQSVLTIRQKASRVTKIRNSLLENKCSLEQYMKMREEEGETDKYQMHFEYKYELFRQHTGYQLPFQKQYVAEIQSKVPMGKCVGSSAAFNTVLAAIFLYLTIGKQKMNLQQVNQISKIFEQVQHGTPSGIDNYVSTYGGLVLFNNKKEPFYTTLRQTQQFKNLKNQFDLYLVDSGMKKNTKKAVNNVRQNYQSSQQYKNMVSQIGTFAKKIVSLLEGKQQNWKSKIVEITSRNHILLKELGVSVDKIEDIVKQWNINGQQSAKITGAGMGGFILVINCKNKKIQESDKVLKIEIENQGLLIKQYLH